MMRKVGLDVLFWDVMWHERSVGEGDVGEGHGDCGDVGAVLYLAVVQGLASPSRRKTEGAGGESKMWRG